MSDENFLNRIKRRVRDSPDSIRLAALGAWRGRERGMAVFAGVFLASLVITTVLSYGVGLSQVFFETSLEANTFDAKVEFRKAPSPDSEGWSNNTSDLLDVCIELEERKEFSDCTVVLGQKGLHGAFDFGNEDVFKAMPLLMQDANSSDDLRNWDEDNLWDYEYTTGPPVATKRAISLLGPGAFDGVIADRISGNIIYDMGNWTSPEEMEEKRGVYIPSDIASQTDAEVNDTLNYITFVYTSETALPGEMEEEDCEGEILISPETGFMHCQHEITVENLTILGIYEPWPQSNPTLAANPIYTTWTILNDTEMKTLIDNDHIFFGVTLDRSLLPTSSTDDAADWLDDLGRDVQSKTYTDSEISLYYADIVSGTILFLNIYLGLIQAFDYIIMIPIVILSLSVLVYGLILSLEQRRREISIHRVIGATAEDLRGMVLLELGVISTVAWFLGYLLAMAAVPVVLASVGFMQFKALGFSVNPALSFGATLFTALTTLGLALIFGRSKARDFMEMEIDEGVSKVQKVTKPKVWLHWSLFIVGSLGAIDTWMEMNGDEDGIITNWFFEGLVNVFGPFMLWIGGALLLGKIGAAGPRIMQFFFSRTPLLSDVKRGLKGSGSAESVNRLSVIMLLTLSIVTLAAVQGYTGTLVDERTADVTVGSDLQLISTQQHSASEIESMISEISSTNVEVTALHIPTLSLTPDDGDSVGAFVLLENSENVLKWLPQAIPGDNVEDALAAYQEGGFSAGRDAAYDMDLWGSGRSGDDDSGDILLDPVADASKVEDVNFVWEDIQLNFSSMSVEITPYNTTLTYIGTHEFIPGVPTAEMESSVIIGESGYRALLGNDRVDNLTATTWIVSVEGDEFTGEELQALRASIEADSRFDSAIDWETSHEEVERNGGLIYGTPGLLSLQFIVASLAAIASAFVFLSLVLNQRQKELAVLQAIGASPNQIIRLVLFEILSIVVVSMGLGVLLGVGLSMAFNGLFNVFGFIFQLLGGASESAITRELQWPWLELGLVACAVFIAVVTALLITTRKALRSDLSSVLKGE
ncbi:MAG: FtsX-like permease family protein [Candidatus Poseidoniaceae archaeon]|jgi:ABC-type antimicrobial peptide transport system permease subunit|nr:FtsX-like permease family protein [Candidatus Poseidoniaceae archaeon]